jgi:hypothetical protein
MRQYYADDVNVVGENIDTIKKNISSIKTLGLSRNESKAREKLSIKIGERSFEDVAEFK